MPTKINPSQLIADNKSEIFSLWVTSVLQEIPEASRIGRAELADHLKIQVNNIIDILKQVKADSTLNDLLALELDKSASSAHGRERASIPDYGIVQLVHEYFVLKRVIIHYCQKHQELDKNYEMLINHIIEFSTLAAIKEYAASTQKVQQKVMGTLVHDVRTPLSVAYSYVELLRVDRELEPASKERIVSTVTRNLNRSVNMLEDLLDSVKANANHGLAMRFAKIDLNQAIKILHSEVSEVYDRSIVAKLANKPVEGVFDATMIIRTLENLLSNAIKFGDKGSTITLSLEDNGDTVSLKVHNFGNPVSPEERIRIFDFFSSGQSPNAKKGWGLGLSLIKVVAEKHGGQMIFDSHHKNGTTFGMTLEKNFRTDGDEVTVQI